MTANEPGFAKAQSSSITLAADSAAEIDFQPNVAGETPQITVTGAAMQAGIDEPQLGDRLSATQIEQIPLLNRKITYFPQLNAANRPAINQGDVFMNENLFTTNGSGPRQTWF